MKKIKNDEHNVRDGEKSRTLNIKSANQARREYVAMREHFDSLSVNQMIRNITK